MIELKSLDIGPSVGYSGLPPKGERPSTDATGNLSGASEQAAGERWTHLSLASRHPLAHQKNAISQVTKRNDKTRPFRSRISAVTPKAGNFKKSWLL